MATDRPAETGASEAVSTSGLDFIRQIVVKDRQAGKNGGRVHTRFPPEPNGFLHIGHAKAICLGFGLAEEHGGLCNLRMDDTNPTTESIEYVQAIKDDVRWLGFDWGDRFFYASDYFEQLHAFAVQLVEAGKAYVCDLPGRRRQRVSRDVEPAGPEQPLPGPVRRREPRPARPDARRRVRGWVTNAARQDRHGVTEHEHARPDDLPNPAGAPLPDRGRVVHLPDVRLHASAVRCARGDYALPLHARVRGPPAPVRLVPPEHRHAVSATPDRVRALEPQLHRAEQAQTAGAGGTGSRGGVGRPAHADDRRVPPTRLHPRGDPRFLRPDRHRQGEQHRLGRAARRCGAAGPQQAGVGA